MKVCVIGSDTRFEYMREQFVKDGYSLCDVADVDDCQVVVFPLPVTRDGIKVNCKEEILLVDIIPKINKHALVLCGGMTNDLSLMFYLNSIKPIDYSGIEGFAVRNAYATAEGAIELAMRNLDTTLLSRKCLVIGNGRIGKFLSNLLDMFNADVTVSARKDKDIAWIECMGYKSADTDDINQIIKDYDVVFNTVPHQLVSPENINENTLFIELAGISTEYYAQAVSRGAKIVDGKAIPSKYAPKTAEKILYETVKTVISEEFI